MTTTPDDAEDLRRRLREVESEQARAFEPSTGFLTLGNPDYVGKMHDLEREADELRVRLGEKPVGAPPQTRRAALNGWLILAG